MMYHSLLGLGAVFVLLAAAAALELYDELSPELSTELLYRGASHTDTGPFRSVHDDDTEATRLNDLLHSPGQSTHKGMPTGDITGSRKGFEDERSGQPQPQWRSETTTMKRPGSDQVCFLKLCKPGK